MNQKRILILILVVQMLSACATSQPVNTQEPSPQHSPTEASTPVAKPLPQHLLPQPHIHSDQVTVAQRYAFQPLEGMIVNVIEDQRRVILGTPGEEMVISMVFEEIPIPYSDLQEVLDSFLFSMAQQIPDLRSGEPLKTILGEKRSISVSLSGTVQGRTSYGKVTIIETDESTHSLFYVLSFAQVGSACGPWTEEAGSIYDKVIDTLDFLEED